MNRPTLYFFAAILAVVYIVLHVEMARAEEDANVSRPNEYGILLYASEHCPVSKATTAKAITYLQRVLGKMPPEEAAEARGFADAMILEYPTCPNFFRVWVQERADALNRLTSEVPQ